MHLLSKPFFVAGSPNRCAVRQRVHSVLAGTRFLYGLCAVLLACAVPGCAEESRAPETVPDSTRSEAHHEEHEGADHEEHGAEVVLDAEAIRTAGITVEPVRRQQVVATFTAPGRVVPTQGGLAHVGTSMAGRITRLYVSEGSAVRRGTPLAEVEAFELGGLRGELLRTRAEVDQRRTALDRQERLDREGLGVKRQLEEARGLHRQALAAQQAVEARLRVAGVGAGTSGSRMSLRAPIAGVVSRRSVALGEYVEPNTDAFEIINTGTVWVDAQVASTAVAGLAVGNPGFVLSNGERGTGRIIYIAPTVDPDSRTVTVRVEIDNRQRGLRPETFVTVEFERGVAGHALAVPKEAIESDGERHYVYREHEPNTFQRVEVERGAGGGDLATITAGVKEGERVAVSGLFYLRSAVQKGELQEHHH